MPQLEAVADADGSLLTGQKTRLRRLAVAEAPASQRIRVRGQIIKNAFRSCRELGGIV